MTKYVLDTAAAKSISAWLVLNRKGEVVATIRAHYGASRVLVNVHCAKDGFQHASASGYGYDKFTAALAGLTIDGHAMTDHCGASLKLPRGLKYFPASYKPRKGYSLANGGTYEIATGKRLDSYHWRDAALAQWRIANGKDESDWPEGETWEDVQRNGRIMARDAETSGRTCYGYSSCYRESGLKYLTAIGYQVMQAI